MIVCRHKKAGVVVRTTPAQQLDNNLGLDRLEGLEIGLTGISLFNGPIKITR